MDETKMAESSGCESLPPAFRGGAGVSNLRNSANGNCARLRRLQWVREDFSESRHLVSAASEAPGIFRVQATRTFGRAQGPESPVASPTTQPKVEVAKTRISSPDVMDAQRTVVSLFGRLCT